MTVYDYAFAFIVGVGGVTATVFFLTGLIITVLEELKNGKPK